MILSETIASQRRKHKDSVMLAKAVLKMSSLGIYTCKKVFQVLMWVRQVLQLDWSSLATWFLGRVPQWMCLLPFDQSSSRRDSGGIPCLYIQGPKVKGEKATKYRKQNRLRRLYSMYSLASQGAAFLVFLFNSTSVSWAATLSLCAWQVQ